jgi:hypothetical protein
VQENVRSRALLLAVFVILAAISAPFIHNKTCANTSGPWNPDDMEQVETVLVTVTNSSDIVDGDTSSIASLIGDPGSDGTISFREAFDAGDHTLGPKVIEFAPELIGAAITFASGGNPLNVTSGDLTIDGDVNNDGLPDITLDGHLGQGAIALISNHNVISHLTFSDFAAAIIVVCPSNCSHRTFMDNRIIGNTFLLPNTGPAITIGPGGLVDPLELPQMTDVTWQDTVISGNTIVSKQHSIYLAAAVGGGSHSRIINLVMSGNLISTQAEVALDIMVADANSAYVGISDPIQYSEYNRIEDVTIADNRINAPNGFGMHIATANFGNANNEISNLSITHNVISAKWAVFICDGSDGSAERGSNNNSITGLDITNNTITSTCTSTGIWLWAGSAGAIFSGSNNRTEDVLIADNRIEDYLGTAIEIVGGIGNGTAYSTGNTVENVIILRNSISQIQNPGTGWGISIMGGNGAADSNKLMGFHLLNNNVRGDIGFQLLGGYQNGARNNEVWIDEIQGNIVNSNGKPINVQNDAEGASGNKVTMPRALTINYGNGRPGSFFTITGVNLPASNTATIIINGAILTNTLPVDSYGGFACLLDTSLADAGYYSLTATVNPSASARFTLDPNAPLRPQNGTGPILSVPSGIAGKMVYLPLIHR